MKWFCLKKCLFTPKQSQNDHNLKLFCIFHWISWVSVESFISATLWKGLFLWVMRRLDKIGTNCHHFLALSQCILPAKNVYCNNHKSTCIPRNVSQKSYSIIVMSWKTITLFLQEILRIEKPEGWRRGGGDRYVF